MPESPNTDLNRAVRDAKKHAGEVSDAAQELYRQNVDSASQTAGSFRKGVTQHHRKAALYGCSDRARARMAIRQNAPSVLTSNDVSLRMNGIS